MHNEWYQIFKSAYLESGERKAIDAVVKRFDVRRKNVVLAFDSEQWIQRVESEQQASSDRLEQFLKKVGIHQRHHETIGFKSAKIATAQLDLHERVQNLLLNRFALIEAETLDPESAEPFIASTLRMMGEASRSLQSTITAVDKSRAIASEALQIEEMVQKTEQLNLFG